MLIHQGDQEVLDQTYPPATVLPEATPHQYTFSQDIAGASTTILPLTVEAKEVGKKGEDRLVSLKHKTRFALAGYTVRVRRESRGDLHAGRAWISGGASGRPPVATVHPVVQSCFAVLTPRHAGRRGTDIEGARSLEV